MLRSLFLTLCLLRAACAGSAPPPCDAAEETCSVHDDGAGGHVLLQAKNAIQNGGGIVQNQTASYAGPWVKQTSGDACIVEVQSSEECGTAGLALQFVAAETEPSGCRSTGANCMYDVVHGCSWNTVGYSDIARLVFNWEGSVGSRDRRQKCSEEHPCICRNLVPSSIGKGTVTLDEYITPMEPGIPLWRSPSSRFSASQIVVTEATMVGRQTQVGSQLSPYGHPPGEAHVVQHLTDANRRFTRFFTNWVVLGYSGEPNSYDRANVKWVYLKVYTLGDVVYALALRAGSKHVEGVSGKTWEDLGNEVAEFTGYASGNVGVAAFSEDNGLGVNGIKFQVRAPPRR